MLSLPCHFRPQHTGPMIIKPPLFKGLDIRIPIRIPIKGKGFIDQASGLTLIKPQTADDGVI